MPRTRFVPPLVGAALGVIFCIWISGPRVLSPREVGWLMRSDWHLQFLSWHLFRNESWHWPPGRVDSYFRAPSGTSIGYTDSIPLVAFALKPFSPLLPMPFQYSSLWWVLCFGLQGLFGVLLLRLWTPSVGQQLAGAAVLALMPTLLARLIHPSLCSHWTLLWALWLYLHPQDQRLHFERHVVVLAVMVGLIHPYLAAMVLALLAAAAVRRRRGYLWLGVAAVLVLVEWWMAGLFLLPAEDLTRAGLSTFSMNLLAIITPSGWSRFMPDIPFAASQDFEGFQYLGAGGLLITIAGLALAVSSARPLPWKAWAPLLTVAVACAIYALSPRVTVGDAVIVDYSSSALERLAFFRVTGRFFWPAAYVLLIASMGLIVRRLPKAAATALLAAAVVLQLLDLQPAHAARRALARDPAFHAWAGELKSPVWAAALPHYDHLVVVLPEFCGAAPATFEGPAYLAGLHGLTVNVGQSGRWSNSGLLEYCKTLHDDLAAGKADDRSIYIVHPRYEALVRTNAPRVVCGEVDRLRVCVTADSYQRWRDAADLR
jgi:Family of unknown function (DUF6311)